MPAIKKVSFGSKFPVAETWTVTFFDINRKLKKVMFKINGSKTGFDGEGNSDKDFLSNSNRVSIKKEDLLIFEIEKIIQKETPDNFQVKFDVVQIVKDTIDFYRDKTNYTIFRGQKSSKHAVELELLEGKVNFKKIIALKPYMH
jgi:hypothetical protein